MIQELTPHEKMGRVMSLTALAQAGLSPLGAFGASALAQWIGARPAMGWLGAASLACVLGTLAFGRELRVQP